MRKFTIFANDFLRQDKIQAFFHTDYVGYRKPGNPDFLNDLKNTYNDYSDYKLNKAAKNLESVLLNDLPQISNILQINPLTVCVVPRAKADASYQPNQLLFKATIRKVVQELNGFSDGTDYIIRHTNTKTTHLPAHTPNYVNDGERPYPGITINTCNLSSDLRHKDVLLIDDLYTKTINIDEDAIQALLDMSVRSVALYTIGCTQRG